MCSDFCFSGRYRGALGRIVLLLMHERTDVGELRWFGDSKCSMRPRLFALLQSLSHHCTTENEQENGVIRVQHGVVIL
jgi:hypothetical protein